jgi:nucleotide-binding universal stress UspA family protein
MLNRLLVVLDEFDPSEIAIKEALHLAGEHGSAVLFVGIVPPLTVPPFEVPSISVLSTARRQSTAEATVRSRIDRGVREASRLELRSAFRLLDPPRSARMVVAVAEEEGCDTIIIASDGRSALGRLIAGSLIPGLITHAPMPVIVCKANRDVLPASVTRTPPTRDPAPVLTVIPRSRPTRGGLAGAPA